MKNKKQIKEKIESQFKSLIKTYKKNFPELKINPRDFDFFCSGYVAGLTIACQDWNKEDVKEIINTLVYSPTAKSIGITRTKFESLEIIK